MENENVPESGTMTTVKLAVKDKKDLIVTSRDIQAAFAYCIIEQSPYPVVENLNEIIEDIRKFIEQFGFTNELEFKDKFSAPYINIDEKALYDIFKKIRDEVPSFYKLNLTKRELDAGMTDPNAKGRGTFTFVSSYNSIPRDNDFIDLDACIRNVINML